VRNPNPSRSLRSRTDTEIEDAEPERGKPDADEPARRRRRPRRTARRRASADPALRRLRRTVFALAIAVLLAAALAGTAWFNHQRAERRDAAVRESTAAAQAIFSYDYRTFDASVTNGRAFVTGEFADEYAQTTTSLKSAAVAEQAVVHAQVSAIAVISAMADHVELLLYLNQYRRNVNIAGEKVDQNRVVLTMIRADGEWKVVKATAI